MKAIQVCVSFDEWEKVERFIADYGDDEDVFIYQVDNVSFVVVAEGECSMGYVTAGIENVFNDANIEVLR